MNRQPDIRQLMKQAQQMQQQLVSAQNEMAQAEVTGQAGGGLVTATVKGTGEVVSVNIDPKVVDPDDIEVAVDVDRFDFAMEVERRPQGLALRRKATLAY